MSYKMRLINRPTAGDHVPKSSLANAMAQGDQPKHACDIGPSRRLKQGEAYGGMKGSQAKSLGGVMGQGGSKRRG